MSIQLNLLERLLEEVDLLIGMAFALFEFGINYRKYNVLYCLSPFERKRIALISMKAARVI